MTRTFLMPVADHVLQQRLRAQDTVLFVGQRQERQDEIREQVARLGFGSLYVVTAIPWLHADGSTIRVEPVAVAGS